MTNGGLDSDFNKYVRQDYQDIIFHKMSVFALLNIVYNDCIAGGNKSRPYLFSDAMFVVAGFIPTSCIGFGNWVLKFEIYL